MDPLHSGPLDAKGPDIVDLVRVLIALASSDQESLLDSGPEAAPRHEIHEIEFLVPFLSDGEKVGVEAQRIPRVDRVVAAKPKARHRKVAIVLEPLEERVRPRDDRQVSRLGRGRGSKRWNRGGRRDEEARRRRWRF